jgi:CubicO group peptidase (beta-lactamase class C family)
MREPIDLSKIAAASQLVAAGLSSIETARQPAPGRCVICRQISDQGTGGGSVTPPDPRCAVVECGAVTKATSLLVPWWSFTKTVLAATALTLVRDGTLGLDQVIDGARYTLRQLLQHTAGLGDYGELADYHAAVARRDDPWSVAELLHRSRASEVRYPPGSDWRYSNIGYLIVRQLIERTTKMPLDAALSRAVFEPMAIKDVTLARERADLRGSVMGEADGYHPGWVYHGLLVGPLHEAARFLDRLLDDSLLPKELIREMRSAHRIGPAIPGRPWREPGYGLGLMMEMAGTGGPVGHTGGGPGTTIAVYRRGRSVSPIVVAAVACGDDQGIVERIAFGFA